MTQSLNQPHWNNNTEYPSLDSAELLYDLKLVENNLSTIERKIKPLEVFFSSDTFDEKELLKNHSLLETIKNIWILKEEAEILNSNISTYAYCLTSVDGLHQGAKALIAKMQALSAELDEACKDFSVFLTKAPAAFIDLLLTDNHFSPAAFVLKQSRKFKEFMLSNKEEKLLSSLEVNGFSAWSNLYDNLSCSIQCQVKTPEGEKTLGIAECSSLLSSSEESTREAAYHAIRNGWSTHEETCASILNALAGWRHSVLKKRDPKDKIDFLHDALHDNRVSRNTVETMLKTVKKKNHIPAIGIQSLARGLKKSSLAPWDLYATPPSLSSQEELLDFTVGLKIVKEAFHKVDPEMANFVSLMEKNQWIEGTVSANKRPGAYCTEFSKSRNPRVYMTYQGYLGDVNTLAHELGHAFHSWTLRDLNYNELHYPMCLAETASIFAETLVAESLLEEFRDKPEALKKVAFEELQSSVAYLMNIPARFDFEHSFYAERKKKEYISSADLKVMMKEAWDKNYGGLVTPADDLFWASKMHFYFSETSFYNFPYTFGYLFSLGVYAQREKLGKEFYPRYKALLRDTGRMEAEELAHKHLSVDLTQESFWLDSLKIVEERVTRAAQFV